MQSKNGSRHIDIRASASIINMETYQDIRCKSKKLIPVNSQLRTCSGDVIKAIGKLDGELIYGYQSSNISFIIANIEVPNLLGRDMLRLLRFELGEIVSYK